MTHLSGSSVFRNEKLENFLRALEDSLVEVLKHLTHPPYVRTRVVESQVEEARLRGLLNLLAVLG